MANKPEKINTGVPLYEQVFCPRCGERLAPADLEIFAACPYCDYVFTRDNNLEDFVLLPLITRWAGRAHNQFPAG